jgi:hypothetical protein
MTAKIIDRDIGKVGRLHEADLYGWVQDQVALLHSGEIGSIDASHITQELEELGRSEFNKLVSALRNVLHHMLKWDHQPKRRSRSWAVTVRTQRRLIEREIKSSPSLKPRILEAITFAYGDAVVVAQSETGLPIATFPERCPYNWDEITSRPIVWDDEHSGERHSKDDF